MDALQKIIIVVPCYNEAQRLDPEAFLRAIETYSWLHLRLVDDGSTDETMAVLQRLCAASSGRITAVALSVNGGKAEAVRRGILEALRDKPDAVGYLDADLSTSFAEVAAMKRVMDERDALLVLGSRVRLLGRQVERQPLRHYLGRIFAMGASLVLALPVYDTQCGAKLLRAEPVIAELFVDAFASRWIFDVEILARLIQLGRRDGIDYFATRVVEYPLGIWRTVAGSRLRATDFFKAAFDLVKIRNGLK